MNTIRISSSLVGFGDKRHMRFTLHVNCPCGIKKSLVGTYATVEEARKDIQPLDNLRSCLKNQPLIEEKQPKKTRRAGRRVTFVRKVADLIREAAPTGASSVMIDETLGAIVERDEAGRFRALIVSNNVTKNFFEFRCPFEASNAGQIATQVWNLMQTMGL